jgi:glycosyltransferase involved in cell wall biosynthesis
MQEPSRSFVVDVVIAVRDQERRVGDWIRAIPPRAARTVLVVDNGSRDQTVRVAEDAGAVVLREPRGGEGAAILRAVAHLSTLPQPPHAVVFLAGDGTAEPSEVPSLLPALSEGHFDLVLGSRTMADTPVPAADRAGAFIATGLIRAIYGHRYSDTGPMRAIRYPALIALGLRDSGSGLWVEMQVKALRRGLRIAEVPVRARAAGEGPALSTRLESSGRTLYHILRHSTAR